jgi:hypothetical protein
MPSRARREKIYELKFFKRRLQGASFFSHEAHSGLHLKRIQVST